MKCRICGAKVTFNSKTSEARNVSSKNAQQLEDKRAEMLAEWKKSKRLSTGSAWQIVKPKVLCSSKVESGKEAIDPLVTTGNAVVSIHY